MLPPTICYAYLLIDAPLILLIRRRYAMLITSRYAIATPADMPLIYTQDGAALRCLPMIRRESGER